MNWDKVENIFIRWLMMIAVLGTLYISIRVVIWGTQGFPGSCINPIPFSELK